MNYKGLSLSALILPIIMHGGDHIKVTHIHNQTVLDYTLDEQVSKDFNELINVETKDAYQHL